MSIESAKAYIERLKTDEEFRDRLKSAEDREARLALVKAEGFDFNVEDLSVVTGEMSEEELDGVSGADVEGMALPCPTRIFQ